MIGMNHCAIPADSAPPPPGSNGQKVAFERLRMICGKFNYRFLKYNGSAWVIQYQATTESQTLDDFAAGIEFNQYDAQSIFVRDLIISKAVADGRVTMSKRNVTISKGEHKKKIAIDRTNYRAMLAHYFGIENIEIKTFDQQ